MITQSRSSSWHAENTVITLLRVTAGVIFVVHGAQKLASIPATTQSLAALGIPMAEYSVYAAIAGELLGGLGLLVGLLTRVAAFGPFAVMLVAIISAHLPHGLLAKDGGFEYPLVLALVSLFFIAHGAGRFSLDALLDRSDTRAFRAQRAASHA